MEPWIHWPMAATYTHLCVQIEQSLSYNRSCPSKKSDRRSDPMQLNRGQHGSLEFREFCRIDTMARLCDSHGVPESIGRSESAASKIPILYTSTNHQQLAVDGVLPHLRSLLYRTPLALLSLLSLSFTRMNDSRYSADERTFCIILDYY